MMAKAKHHFLRLLPSTFFGFFLLLSSLCIASMKITTVLIEMLHCTSLIAFYYYHPSTATAAYFCTTIIYYQNPWNRASPLQLKLLSSCTNTTSSLTFNTPKYASVVSPLCTKNNAAAASYNCRHDESFIYVIRLSSSYTTTTILLLHHHHQQPVSTHQTIRCYQHIRLCFCCSFNIIKNKVVVYKTTTTSSSSR